MVSSTRPAPRRSTPSSRRVSNRVGAGREPGRGGGVASSTSSAAAAAVSPDTVAWYCAPTCRSGRYTSGASSRTSSPARRSSEPETSRSPTDTATSATDSVASSSSTNDDRNAQRSAAIVCPR